MVNEPETEPGRSEYTKNKEYEVDRFVGDIPTQFFGDLCLSRRREVPVKIITAHRAAENKTGKVKRKRNRKKKAGLINHQHRASCNEQTGENKKIKDFFQHGA